MSKYIPKVGESCILIHANKSLCDILILAETDAEFWVQFLDGKRTTVVSKYGKEFRPIPTKADGERDLMMYCLSGGETDGIVADMLQGKGFTIPKKLKRSELADVMESYYITYEAKVSIFSEICDLLGDLVEDD